MKFSSLQKYILQQTYLNKGRISRKRLEKFYEGKKKKPKKEDIVNIITKSIDRLIRKELLTGFGTKTAQKWFVKDIRLTPGGRKQARKLLGEQLTLPFKKKTLRQAQGFRNNKLKK